MVALSRVYFVDSKAEVVVLFDSTCLFKPFFDSTFHGVSFLLLQRRLSDDKSKFTMLTNWCRALFVVGRGKDWIAFAFSRRDVAPAFVIRCSKKSISVTLKNALGRVYY